MGLDAKYISDAMESRCKRLEKFIEMRNYDIGYRNKEFLTIYFSAMCMAYDRTYAKGQIREINRKLKNNLSEESVEKIITSINKQNMLSYKNETVIQRLGITEEEVEVLGFYDHRKKMEKRKEKKDKKEKLRNEIIEDYRNGMIKKDIFDKYCNSGKISKSTVKRWLQEVAESKKEERNDQIIRFYSSGASYSQISEVCGCSLNTVKSVIENCQKGSKRTKKESIMTVKESYQSKDDLALKGISLYKTEVKVSSVSDYQLALLKLKGTRNNVFLYGNAGTGKSHAIKEWLYSMDDEQLKTVTIVAPTGRAAENLNGSTIHSVFKFPLGVLPKPNIDDMTIPTALENTEILIIDEVSMCRIDVFENVIQTIRLIEQTYNRTIKIVTVGDFGQLEPTATRNDKRLLKQWYQGSIYAFQSELWQQCNFQKIKLTYVFRQNEPTLSEMLNEIKFGVKEAIDFFNKNAARLLDERAIYITSLKSDANKHNLNAIGKFSKKQLKTYKAKCKADVSDEELPTESELTLAVGMRIICTCNDCEGLYTNGSLGTVTRLLKNAVMVLLDNGCEVEIKYKVFKLPSGAVWLMLPLSYGYAITVQRSQGCTFDYVAIDSGESGFFSVGALYVALSRCKSIGGLYLETPLRNKELKINIDALRMTL